MDATDVILCGLVWAQFRQPEAGLELVRAIESADPEPQSLAEVMLEQAGLCSEEVVKDAIAKDSYAALETTTVVVSALGHRARGIGYWWLPSDLRLSSLQVCCPGGCSLTELSEPHCVPARRITFHASQCSRISNFPGSPCPDGGSADMVSPSLPWIK